MHLRSRQGNTAACVWPSPPTACAAYREARGELDVSRCMMRRHEPASHIGAGPQSAARLMARSCNAMVNGHGS